ncbi:MAG: hypothetical protein DRI75_13350 [Bacteroidetes bacterium]|nr:MAG: hypothetical protein DRI75_13350 [Bacteroidota bacterium]
MIVKKLNNPTAERFIIEAMGLIEEKNGSIGVNLREISKRVGCAHTNAYNYFESFTDLMWYAFDRTLEKYLNTIITGLDNKLSGYQYFKKLVNNLLRFALENPGLYRFISSDPLDIKNIPEDVLQKVTKMKYYFIEVIMMLTRNRIPKKDAENVANIILSYLDGETFNLINERYLPEDKIEKRIVSNTILLFSKLTSTGSGNYSLKSNENKTSEFIFPTLEQ